MLSRYLVIERFFRNLKTERLWQNRYANPLEATDDISRYIVECTA